MQEGTSVGLMTLVTIVGFGILFSILITFMPQLRLIALDVLQSGVNSAPTPK